MQRWAVIIHKKPPYGYCFDKIAAGLEDAIAYVGGDISRGREANIDVRAIRAATGKTQARFAADFHLPVGTVRDWEQGRRQPGAPVLSASRHRPRSADRSPPRIDRPRL